MTGETMTLSGGIGAWTCNSRTGPGGNFPKKQGVHYLEFHSKREPTGPGRQSFCPFRCIKNREFQAK
jgi:hypothetical protein